MSDTKSDEARQQRLAAILAPRATASTGSGGSSGGDQKPTEKKSMGGGQGMDRRVKKKVWTPQRIGLIVAGLAFVALIIWGLTQTGGGSTLRVDRDKLTISTVQIEPFQEYISQTGNVEPRRTIYLDAIEGGRVEEVFVREGEIVDEDQPLLRLSNNDLQLRLLNAETNRIEQVNRLQNTRFQIEQNNLRLRQDLTDMNYNITRLEREFNRFQELFRSGSVSEQEFQQVKDEYDWYKSRRQLTIQSYQQDSLRQSLQIDQMERSIQQLDANFALLQSTLANLTVRAPVSGHLTALDAEIGELRASGSRFGQIDVLDGYKVTAGIDEFYINRVRRGQTATTLPIAGQEYQLQVLRVYPEVRDGRFEVDMEFVGQVPPNIRRGQTIRFRLEMSDPQEATTLPRGGFYNSTGGNWVYVVTADGNEAVRRDISIGRQNTQVYEVTGGLEPGDQVVTSSYETFGDADRLVW